MSNQHKQSGPNSSGQKPVILTCAITGSIHVPSMSPYLPLTPAQIAEESIAAAEAGASIIHLHARDPLDGRPTADPNVFMQFLPLIRQSTNAVLNLSTGGAPGMTMDQRLAAAERFSPEMTSLNMGSINNGLFAGIPRIREWKHDWERPYMESTKGGVFRNTFEDIETILSRLGKGQGCRFEFECYDVSHLYNLAYIAEQKLYEPPFFIQIILGVLGGIGPGVEHLMHMIGTARQLFGGDFEWSVLGVGRHQMGLCTHNALLGGNVRVGLEDNLFIAPGEFATSNRQQVEKIRRILTELSIPVATPEEARKRLHLKGESNVRI